MSERSQTFPGTVAESLSTLRCGQGADERLAADSASTCGAVATAAYDRDTSNQTTRIAGNWPDESIEEANRGQPQVTTEFSQRAFEAASPSPGQTMVEICMTSLAGDRYRCNTGRSNELPVLAEPELGVVARAGYTISGRVLTPEGFGLGGIAIVATPRRLRDQRLASVETLRFRTVTNSLGGYSLNGLPEGDYTIRSSARGVYRSTRYTARTGVDYADLVVARDRATVVEGIVIAATGEPLEGVTVLPMVMGQPSALTGNDGRFRMSVNLKPGIESLALRFQRPGFLEQKEEVRPGNFANDGARMVKAVMQPVESWTSLNGTVYSDGGEALPGRSVELRPSGGQRAYTATTDIDGKYSFPFIEAPVEYQLSVLGGSDHKDFRQALHLTADTSEYDVIIESYEYGAVTGRIVNANGVPVPDFELVFRNVDSRNPNAMVSTDAFGNFEIEAAPAGEFVVASQSAPSMLVNGLRLRSGDELHLPLVLDWGNHEIRGVVVDESGNPVPASRIVLQWSHQAGGITTSSTRRTAADTQGQFAFSNLGPGPHSLRVEAPGFRRVDLDHDLSRQGYAVTVKVN